MGPNDLSQWTDNEVLAKARETHAAMDKLPREHPDRSALLARMGVLYGEMNRRGMNQVVTEGSAVNPFEGQDS